MGLVGDTFSRKEVIAKSEAGVMKIRSKIILVTDDGVAAVCKACGEEVPVPILKKSNPLAAQNAGPPLILSK